MNKKKINNFRGTAVMGGITIIGSIFPFFWYCSFSKWAALFILSIGLIFTFLVFILEKAQIHK